VHVIVPEGQHHRPAALVPQGRSILPRVPFRQVLGTRATPALWRTPARRRMGLASRPAASSLQAACHLALKKRLWSILRVAGTWSKNPRRLV